MKGKNPIYYPLFLNFVSYKNLKQGMPDQALIKIVCKKLTLPERSIIKTISLFDEGATIPFIARYRKEATGSLDEVQIQNIQTEWNRLLELVKRKEYIIKTIEEQEKLTSSLKKHIQDCWEENILEDLYLPFKKKRKTRAVKARDLGLEPLANLIWQQKTRDLNKVAKTYIKEGAPDLESVMQGAKDIIAEKISEDSYTRNKVRQAFLRHGAFTSKVIKSKKLLAEKFKDYFEFSERANKAPAHRVLALYRGEQEGYLRVKLAIDADELCQSIEKNIIKYDATHACRKALKETIQDAYNRLLSPSIETETRKIYKEKADQEAIRVFAENLKQLLLSAPLGSKRIMGIDPGFRTGCKVVCLDYQGNLVFNSAIYPHPPQNKMNEALDQINMWVDKYQIEAIAIGNGTAGKESYAMLKNNIFKHKLELFMVNESGASIYSASEIARNEFPNLDITVRGAVSIGRRLMDPLSELVKIDPKSIGVGQYQHDVNQIKLKNDLERVVENCVNKVGVNLNTASEYLLTFVSGLGPALANNIVKYRKENGAFERIQNLKKIPRMGAKAFEQSAGFLRIREAKNPLDNTGVHPERYLLVKQMAKDLNATVEQLIADESLRRKIQTQLYISSEVGLPTIKDIINELEKPGLDIRGAAKSFEFSEGINSIEDLKVGMRVKGIINNITKFGAFVDLGIKDSGLIHISQIADRFVKDPLEVVKLNQEVDAKIIEVDVNRKRISLSLKS